MTDDTYCPRYGVGGRGNRTPQNPPEPPAPPAPGWGFLRSPTTTTASNATPSDTSRHQQTRSPANHLIQPKPHLKRDNSHAPPKANPCGAGTRERPPAPAQPNERLFYYTVTEEPARNDLDLDVEIFPEYFSPNHVTLSNSRRVR